MLTVKYMKSDTDERCHHNPDLNIRIQSPQTGENNRPFLLWEGISKTGAVSHYLGWEKNGAADN